MAWRDLIRTRQAPEAGLVSLKAMNGWRVLRIDSLASAQRRGSLSMRASGEAWVSEEEGTVVMRGES